MAITFVQSTNNNTSTASFSLFTANCGIGDLLVVQVWGAPFASQTALIFTDNVNTGNYTTFPSLFDSGGSQRQYWLAWIRCNAASSSPPTVSCAGLVGQGTMFWTYALYTGFVGTASYAGTGSSDYGGVFQNTSSTTITGPSFTTSKANEFVISFGGNLSAGGFGTFSSGASGWTHETQHAGDNSSSIYDKLLPTLGTAQLSGVVTASIPYFVQQAGFYDFVPSTILVVQQNGNATTSTVSSIAVTLPSAVTAGSSIWVPAFATFAGGIVLSVADNLNGSYSLALDSVHSIAGVSVNGHWHIDNAVAGSTTITLTCTAAVAGMGIAAYEIGVTSGYMGLHAAADLTTPPGSGTNATTTANMLPTYQPGMIIAQANKATGTGAYTAGTGFTSLGPAAGWLAANNLSEWQRFATATLLAGAFTDANGASGESVVLAAMFKELGALPPPILPAGPMPRQLYVMP